MPTENNFLKIKGLINLMVNAVAIRLLSPYVINTLPLATNVIFGRI